MDHIFTREFNISSYDLNPRAQARLTTIANFFQETAYHHASELGFGYHDMKDRGTTWVLSRMRIRMDRFPVWDERISIETWPSGIDKLFALREFRIRDAEGKVIGKAATAWLILNIESHRLIRPREEFERFKMVVTGDRMFSEALDKIDLPPADAEHGLKKVGSHRVVFSDLDILGHVNNVKYMEWCIDAGLNSLDSGREIREFEINFNHEALFRDLVEINMAKADSGSCLFLASREGDGQEIIRARLQWAD